MNNFAKAAKKISSKLALIILSLILCMALIEAALRSGFLDGSDDPHPIWIPQKYRQLNKNINALNLLNAKANSFGFNDRERDIRKREGVYRIAVLGDSYVWGDGLPYEMTWNHKLEKKINDCCGDAVEVLSWGKCGWSTLDEYDFFRQRGVNFGIDLLIVGFVTNDPDMGDKQQKYFHIGNPKILKKMFPNLIDFFQAHLENFVAKIRNDYGYPNWLNKLYTNDNLQKYSTVLLKFSSFCNDHGVRLLFVLTPRTYEQFFRDKHDKVIPLLKKANIPYLDLFPAVDRNLKKYKIRDLWSNKANAHPGPLVTEVFANEVFQFFHTNVDAGTIKLNKSESQRIKRPLK